MVEIAEAITQIKSEAREGIERKEVLEGRIIDLRTKEDDYVKSSPKYARLERLNKEINRQKGIYLRNYEEWNHAKTYFRFEDIELLE